MRKILRHASLLAFALPMILSSCMNSGDKLENVDLIPVKISKDGHWSMVDSKGEIVYDGEFKNTPSMAYNGLFSVEEEKGISVYSIGDKNPKLLGCLEGLKAAGYLEDGLMPVVPKDSRITLVNKAGEKKFELAPIKGVEIASCSNGFSEGLLLFKTADDKFGYYSTSGEVAIAPQYDIALDFSEGLAIVGKKQKDKEFEYSISVIDKKGKVQFKLKDDFDVHTTQFSDGYILAERDDRLYLFNKKGEEKKLPAKFESVAAYNKKYIIFESDDEYGIADINGEIIVRAKYSGLAFDTDDTFFAKKNSDDKEIIRLNSKGEEIGDKIDYEYIANLKKFGYFARDGKTTLMLDDNLKPKCKEEFYDMSLGMSASGLIESDYFSADDIAKAVVDMFDGSKIGKYKFGDAASNVFSGEQPSKYSYENNGDLSDLDFKGFRYSTSVTGVFSETISNGMANYSTYTYDYYWNPEAKLCGFIIGINCENQWGKKGQKALVDALKSNGYKMLKEGQSDGDFAALLKKGNILAYVSSTPKGNDGGLLFVDSSIRNIESEIMADIRSLTSDEPDSDSVWVEESVAVEEAVVDSVW